MPSCSSSNRNQEYSHVVVLFDNSYSMGTKNADGVIIEQARSQARTMLSGLAQEAQVRLFTQDPLTNTGWMSPAQALSVIDTIPLCPQQRKWSDWTAQVDELLHEGGIASLKVMAFGDGQLSAMADKPQLISAPAVDWEFVLYPLDPTQSGGNVGIDTVWYESVWQNADAAAHVLLKAKIRNYSESPKETSVRMLGQGKTLHVKSIKLEAQGTAEVQFALSDLEMTQASLLQLDEDGFGYDNIKYLHPIKQNQTVVGVLGIDDAVTALFASQPLLKKVDLKRADLLSGNKGVLQSAHAIVLINDAVYTAQEMASLRDFVASGKGVIQFFADPIRRKNFNLGFGDLRGEWLGSQTGKGVLSRNKGPNLDRDLQVDRLALAGFQHPIFQNAFGESISEKTEMPWVGGHFKLESSLDFETVLQLESGDPILLQRVQGTGSYWVWLSDLRSGSQSLKSSVWFLPIFTQIIASSAVVEQSLYGELFSGNLLPLPSNVQVDERAAKLRGKSCNIVIDLQQNSSQHTSMYVGSQPQYPGYFCLVGSSGEDSVQIALNLGKQESDLRSFADWKSISLGGGNGLTLSQGNGITPIMHNAPLNTPWCLFIWGAAFFFAVEVVIILLKDRIITSESVKL
ncbi:hypothetical protein LBMAG26_07280 [Bacteroidota bacterium]|nr:hypothetical protein LBMAG26_07280 [Bacteroidota bacterium]